MKNKSLIILLVIFLLCVIAGGSYLYFKGNKTTGNSNGTSIDGTEDFNYFSERLYSFLSDKFVYDEKGNVNVIYDTDYINDEVEKAYIIRALVIGNMNVNKNFISPDGTEESGWMNISLDDYKNQYKSVFGKDFDESKLATDVVAPIIKDGYIYFKFATGTDNPTMEYVSCNQNKDNKTLVFNYKNEAVKIDATITIKYIVSSDKQYTIKSFMAQKNN